MSYVTVDQFNALVNQFGRDVNALQNAVNKLALDNGGLRTELATVKQQLALMQQNKSPVTPVPSTIDGEVIVGRHPVTGQPVTKAQLDKNPKLGLTMRFSEDDGG